MKELYQSNLLCTLGDGVQLRLEPVFCDPEQGVHLALWCEVGVVCLLIKLHHHLTGGAKISSFRCV